MPPQEMMEYQRGERLVAAHLPALRRPSTSDQRCSELGIKCVLVGDGAVGKSSLIISYTTNGYPMDYQPTAFDTYSALVQVDGTPVRIQLCDTAGQEDFDRLRSLCYPGTDVMILCFSVVNPSSFQNITEKWIHEIRSYRPDVPVVLVGTQADLRHDVNVLIELNKHRVKPITKAQAQSLADKLRAKAYVECSALTQKNLKEAFDAAILAAINYKAACEKKLANNRMKTLSKCRWKKFFCFV
ncbi:rho-related GTP-binding protein RhoV [Latimeria chalumnae]|uniref:Ras homolog family member V n=1 Tax=Latimeria chalumnae TaxID=7897 RepID=H3A713_LATCH|nr:PREDICTED: rho-related GTP-binding protein RhoV [Latimeria chalumnae]|eukprot:XP_006012103.1 PREDICTED: rho-related GTP-binding protein RhoV [Latimeria chalumnae]